MATHLQFRRGIELSASEVFEVLVMLLKYSQPAEQDSTRESPGRNDERSLADSLHSIGKDDTITFITYELDSLLIAAHEL
jgi:hypothetical protein